MEKIKELIKEWGPLMVSIAVLTAVVGVSEWIGAVLGSKARIILTNSLKKK